MRKRASSSVFASEVESEALMAKRSGALMLGLSWDEIFPDGLKMVMSVHLMDFSLSIWFFNLNHLRSHFFGVILTACLTPSGVEAGLTLGNDGTVTVPS